LLKSGGRGREAEWSRTTEMEVRAHFMTPVFIMGGKKDFEKIWLFSELL
jgi:hypothetical protein